LDQSSLWAVVLKSKYGKFGNAEVQRSSRNDSLWWRDLVEVCRVGKNKECYDKSVAWKVGDDRKILLWHQPWEGVECLATKFRRLFMNSEQKQSIYARQY